MSSLERGVGRAAQIDNLDKQNEGVFEQFSRLPENVRNIVLAAMEQFKKGAEMDSQRAMAEAKDLVAFAQETLKTLEQERLSGADFGAGVQKQDLPKRLADLAQGFRERHTTKQ